MQTEARRNRVEPSFRKLIKQCADRHTVPVNIDRTEHYYLVEFEGMMGCLMHRKLGREGWPMVNIEPTESGGLVAGFEIPNRGAI